MGISIQACSCLKNQTEEKKSEFKPTLTYNPSLKKKNIFDYYPMTTTVNSVNNNEEKEKLSKEKSFSFKEENQNYIIIDSEDIIKQKEQEIIPESLLEADLLLKKEFNKEFLSNIDLKENEDINNKEKIKTDCLIRKNNLNEEISIYKGEIDSEGNYNGFGELYLKAGKKYEGIFINNKLNGYGRLIDLFGNICYEGYFKDNQLLDGKGKIIKINEDGNIIIYKGDIKNMKKEGKGIEENSKEGKKYTYQGSFQNDLYEGNGKIIFDKNEFYEGDFKNGKMTGIGYYKWKDNTSYEGEFLDGKKHGKGIFKWPDKSEYEGSYVNNIKEGYGEYRWPNGKKYLGMFKNGEKHGKGVYIKKTGEKKEVFYDKGVLVKNYPADNDNNKGISNENNDDKILIFTGSKDFFYKENLSSKDFKE